MHSSWSGGPFLHLLKSSYTETPLTQPESSHPPLCAHTVLWSSSTSHVSRLLVFCVVHMLSHFSYIQLFATLWTVNLQAPLYLGFSRREYWNELPCPPPGHLPNPGIKPSSRISPALAGRFFTSVATCGPCVNSYSPLPHGN